MRKVLLVVVSAVSALALTMTLSAAAQGCGICGKNLIKNPGAESGGSYAVDVLATLASGLGVDSLESGRKALEVVRVRSPTSPGARPRSAPSRTTARCLTPAPRADTPDVDRRLRPPRGGSADRLRLDRGSAGGPATDRLPLLAVINET